MVVSADFAIMGLILGIKWELIAYTFENLNPEINNDIHKKKEKCKVYFTFNIFSISSESKSFLPTVRKASATLNTISIPSDRNTSIIRQASGNVRVVVNRVRNQLLAYSDVLKLCK